MKNNSHSETERKDVYQIITDRILDLLQKGVVPWQKPWATSGQDCSPRNLVSGKAYRGINIFRVQCDGIKYAKPEQTAREHNAIESAERIVLGMPELPEPFRWSTWSCLRARSVSSWRVPTA